jgi:hypothetical protein
MNPNYPLVAEQAGHRCEYCHAPEAAFNLAFEVEHILPRSKGGADDESNWALACRRCNLRKHDFIDGIDPVTQEKAPLFHPRRDSWQDHFEIQRAEPFLIKGKTATGRTTIERLDMNAEEQLEARAQWNKLELFP